MDPDKLDTSEEPCLDSLSLDEIYSIYQKVFQPTEDIRQVLAGVYQVSGAQGVPGQCCTRELLDALVEVEKRRWLKEQLYWDFQLLDSDGDSFLTMEDTKLFLQRAQEFQVTQKTWLDFLRECAPSEPFVSWDMLEDWLFGNPVSSIGPEGDLQCHLTTHERGKEAVPMADIFKGDGAHGDEGEDGSLHSLDDPDGSSKNGVIYQWEMKKRSHLLQERWEVERLAALVNSGGQETMDEPLRVMEAVSSSDVAMAVQWKYEMLLKKLYEEMLEEHYGESVWSSKSSLEKEARMSELEVLADFALQKSSILVLSQLPGGSLQVRVPTNARQDSCDEAATHHTSINTAVQSLEKLHERMEEEKRLLVFGPISVHERSRELVEHGQKFLQLYVQAVQAQREPTFQTAVLAVEHQWERRFWDSTSAGLRDCQEELAKLRLANSQRPALDWRMGHEKMPKMGRSIQQTILDWLILTQERDRAKFIEMLESCRLEDLASPEEPAWSEPIYLLPLEDHTERDPICPQKLEELTRTDATLRDLACRDPTYTESIADTTQLDPNNMQSTDEPTCEDTNYMSPKDGTAAPETGNPVELTATLRKVCLQALAMAKYNLGPKGQDSSWEDLAVSMLLDLQLKQEAELRNVIACLADGKEEELSELYVKYVTQLQDQHVLVNLMHHLQHPPLQQQLAQSHQSAVDAQWRNVAEATSQGFSLREDGDAHLMEVTVIPGYPTEKKSSEEGDGVNAIEGIEEKAGLLVVDKERSTSDERTVSKGSPDELEKAVLEATENLIGGLLCLKDKVGKVLRRRSMKEAESTALGESQSTKEKVEDWRQASGVKRSNQAKYKDIPASSIQNSGNSEDRGQLAPRVSMLEQSTRTGFKQQYTLAQEIGKEGKEHKEASETVSKEQNLPKFGTGFRLQDPSMPEAAGEQHGTGSKEGGPSTRKTEEAATVMTQPTSAESGECTLEEKARLDAEEDTEMERIRDWALTVWEEAEKMMGDLVSLREYVRSASSQRSATSRSSDGRDRSRPQTQEMLVKKGKTDMCQSHGNNEENVQDVPWEKHPACAGSHSHARVWDPYTLCGPEKEDTAARESPLAEDTEGTEIKKPENARLDSSDEELDSTAGNIHDVTSDEQDPPGEINEEDLSGQSSSTECEVQTAPVLEEEEEGTHEADHEGDTSQAHETERESCAIDECEKPPKDEMLGTVKEPGNMQFEAQNMSTKEMPEDKEESTGNGSEDDTTPAQGMLKKEKSMNDILKSDWDVSNGSQIHVPKGEEKVSEEIFSDGCEQQSVPTEQIGSKEDEVPQETVEADSMKQAIIKEKHQRENEDNDDDNRSWCVDQQPTEHTAGTEDVKEKTTEAGSKEQNPIDERIGEVITADCSEPESEESNLPVKGVSRQNGMVIQNSTKQAKKEQDHIDQQADGKEKPCDIELYQLREVRQKQKSNACRYEDQNTQKNQMKEDEEVSEETIRLGCEEQDYSMERKDEAVADDLAKPLCEEWGVILQIMGERHETTMAKSKESILTAQGMDTAKVEAERSNGFKGEKKSTTALQTAEEDSREQPMHVCQGSYLQGQGTQLQEKRTRKYTEPWSKEWNPQSQGVEEIGLNTEDPCITFEEHVSSIQRTEVNQAAGQNSKEVDPAVQQLVGEEGMTDEINKTTGFECELTSPGAKDVTDIPCFEADNEFLLARISEMEKGETFKISGSVCDKQDINRQIQDNDATKEFTDIAEQAMEPVAGDTSANTYDPPQQDNGKEETASVSYKGPVPLGHGIGEESVVNTTLGCDARYPSIQKKEGEEETIKISNKEMHIPRQELEQGVIENMSDACDEKAPSDQRTEWETTGVTHSPRRESLNLLYQPMEGYEKTSEISCKRLDQSAHGTGEQGAFNGKTTQASDEQHRQPADGAKKETERTKEKIQLMHKALNEREKAEEDDHSRIRSEPSDAIRNQVEGEYYSSKHSCVDADANKNSEDTRETLEQMSDHSPTAIETSGPESEEHIPPKERDKNERLQTLKSGCAEREAQANVHDQPKETKRDNCNEQNPPAEEEREGPMETIGTKSAEIVSSAGDQDVANETHEIVCAERVLSVRGTVGPMETPRTSCLGRLPSADIKNDSMETMGSTYEERGPSAVGEDGPKKIMRNARQEDKHIHAKLDGDEPMESIRIRWSESSSLAEGSSDGPIVTIGRQCGERYTQAGEKDDGPKETTRIENKERVPSVEGEYEIAVATMLDELVEGDSLAASGEVAKTTVVESEGRDLIPEKEKGKSTEIIRAGLEKRGLSTEGNEVELNTIMGSRFEENNLPSERKAVSSTGEGFTASDSLPGEEVGQVDTMRREPSQLDPLGKEFVGNIMETTVTGCEKCHHSSLTTEEDIHVDLGLSTAKHENHGQTLQGIDSQDANAMFWQAERDEATAMVRISANGKQDPSAQKTKEEESIVVETTSAVCDESYLPANHTEENREVSPDTLLQTVLEATEHLMGTLSSLKERIGKAPTRSVVKAGVDVKSVQGKQHTPSVDEPDTDCDYLTTSVEDQRGLLLSETEGKSKSTTLLCGKTAESHGENPPEEIPDPARGGSSCSITQEQEQACEWQEQKTSGWESLHPLLYYSMDVMPSPVDPVKTEMEMPQDPAECVAASTNNPELTSRNSLLETEMPITSLLEEEEMERPENMACDIETCESGSRPISRSQLCNDMTEAGCDELNHPTDTRDVTEEVLTERDSKDEKAKAVLDVTDNLTGGHTLNDTVGRASRRHDVEEGKEGVLDRNQKQEEEREASNEQMSPEHEVPTNEQVRLRLQERTESDETVRDTSWEKHPECSTGDSHARVLEQDSSCETHKRRLCGCGSLGQGSPQELTITILQTTVNVIGNIKFLQDGLGEVSVKQPTTGLGSAPEDEGSAGDAKRRHGMTDDAGKELKKSENVFNDGEATGGETEAPLELSVLLKDTSEAVCEQLPITAEQEKVVAYGKTVSTRFEDLNRVEQGYEKREVMFEVTEEDGHEEGSLQHNGTRREKEIANETTRSEFTEGGCQTQDVYPKEEMTTQRMSSLNEALDLCVHRVQVVNENTEGSTRFCCEAADILTHDIRREHEGKETTIAGCQEMGQLLPGLDSQGEHGRSSMSGREDLSQLSQQKHEEEQTTEASKLESDEVGQVMKTLDGEEQTEEASKSGSEGIGQLLLGKGLKEQTKETSKSGSEERGQLKQRNCAEELIDEKSNCGTKGWGEFERRKGGEEEMKESPKFEGKEGGQLEQRKSGEETEETPISGRDGVCQLLQENGLEEQTEEAPKSCSEEGLLSKRVDGERQTVENSKPENDESIPLLEITYVKVRTDETFKTDCEMQAHLVEETVGEKTLDELIPLCKGNDPTDENAEQMEMRTEDSSEMKSLNQLTSTLLKATDSMIGSLTTLKEEMGMVAKQQLVKAADAPIDQGQQLPEQDEGSSAGKGLTRPNQMPPQEKDDGEMAGDSRMLVGEQDKNQEAPMDSESASHGSEKCLLIAEGNDKMQLATATTIAAHERLDILSVKSIEEDRVVTKITTISGHEGTELLTQAREEEIMAVTKETTEAECEGKILQSHEEMEATANKTMDECKGKDHLSQEEEKSTEKTARDECEGKDHPSQEDKEVTENITKDEGDGKAHLTQEMKVSEKKTMEEVEGEDHSSQEEVRVNEERAECEVKDPTPKEEVKVSEDTSTSECKKMDSISQEEAKITENISMDQCDEYEPPLPEEVKVSKDTTKDKCKKKDPLSQEEEVAVTESTINNEGEGNDTSSQQEVDVTDGIPKDECEGEDAPSQEEAKVSKDKTGAECGMKDCSPQEKFVITESTINNKYEGEDLPLQQDAEVTENIVIHECEEKEPASQQETKVTENITNDECEEKDLTYHINLEVTQKNTRGGCKWKDTSSQAEIEVTENTEWMSPLSQDKVEVPAKTTNGVCQGKDPTSDGKVEVNEDTTAVGCRLNISPSQEEEVVTPMVGCERKESSSQVDMRITETTIRHKCEGKEPSSQVDTGITKATRDRYKEKDSIPQVDTRITESTRDECEGKDPSSQVDTGITEATRDKCEGKDSSSQVDTRITETTRDKCEGKDPSSEVDTRITETTIRHKCERKEPSSQVDTGITKATRDRYKEKDSIPQVDTRITESTRDECEGKDPSSQVDTGITEATRDKCEGKDPSSQVDTRITETTRDKCEGKDPSSEVDTRITETTRDKCEGKEPLSQVDTRITETVRDKCEVKDPSSQVDTRITETTRDKCEGKDPSSEVDTRITEATRDKCEGKDPSSQSHVKVNDDTIRDECEGKDSSTQVNTRIPETSNQDECEGYDSSLHPNVEVVEDTIRDVCERKDPLAQEEMKVIKNTISRKQEVEDPPSQIVKNASLNKTRTECEGNDFSAQENVHITANITVNGIDGKSYSVQQMEFSSDMILDAFRVNCSSENEKDKFNINTIECKDKDLLAQQGVEVNNCTFRDDDKSEDDLVQDKLMFLEDTPDTGLEGQFPLLEYHKEDMTGCPSRDGKERCETPTEGEKLIDEAIMTDLQEGQNLEEQKERNLDKNTSVIGCTKWDPFTDREDALTKLQNRDSFEDQDLLTQREKVDEPERVTAKLVTIQSSTMDHEAIEEKRTDRILCDSESSDDTSKPVAMSSLLSQETSESGNMYSDQMTWKLVKEATGENVDAGLAKPPLWRTNEENDVVEKDRDSKEQEMVEDQKVAEESVGARWERERSTVEDVVTAEEVVEESDRVGWEQQSSEAQRRKDLDEIIMEDTITDHKREISSVHISETEGRKPEAETRPHSQEQDLYSNKSKADRDMPDEAKGTNLRQSQDHDSKSHSIRTMVTEDACRLIYQPYEQLIQKTEAEEKVNVVSLLSGCEAHDLFVQKKVGQDDINEETSRNRHENMEPQSRGSRGTDEEIVESNKNKFENIDPAVLEEPTEEQVTPEITVAENEGVCISSHGVMEEREVIKGDTRVGHENMGSPLMAALAVQEVVPEEANGNGSDNVEPLSQRGMGETEASEQSIQTGHEGMGSPSQRMIGEKEINELNTSVGHENIISPSQRVLKEQEVTGQNTKVGCTSLGSPSHRMMEQVGNEDVGSPSQRKIEEHQFTGPGAKVRLQAIGLQPQIVIGEGMAEQSSGASHEDMDSPIQKVIEEHEVTWQSDRAEYQDIDLSSQRIMKKKELNEQRTRVRHKDMRSSSKRLMGEEEMTEQSPRDGYRDIDSPLHGLIGEEVLTKERALSGDGDMGSPSEKVTGEEGKETEDRIRNSHEATDPQLWGSTDHSTVAGYEDMDKLSHGGIEEEVGPDESIRDVYEVTDHTSQGISEEGVIEESAREGHGTMGHISQLMLTEEEGKATENLGNVCKDIHQVPQERMSEKGAAEHSTVDGHEGMDSLWLGVSGAGSEESTRAGHGGLDPEPRVVMREAVVEVTESTGIVNRDIHPVSKRVMLEEGFTEESTRSGHEDMGHTLQGVMVEKEEVTLASSRAGHEDTGHTSQGVMVDEEVTRVSYRAGHEDTGHASQGVMVDEEMTQVSYRAGHEDTGITTHEIIGEEKEVIRMSSRSGHDDTAHPTQGIMGEEVNWASSRAGNVNTGPTSQELMGEVVTRTSSRAGHKDAGHASQGIMGEEVTWTSSGHRDAGHASQGIMGEEVTQTSSRAGHRDASYASQRIMREEVTRMSSRAGYEDTGHASQGIMGKEVIRVSSRAGDEETGHTSQRIMGEEVTRSSSRAENEDTSSTIYAIVGEDKEVIRASSRSGHDDIAHTSQGVMGEDMAQASSRAGHRDTGHTSKGIVREEVTRVSSRAGHEDTGHTSQGLMVEQVTWASYRARHDEAGHTVQGIMGEVTQVSSRAGPEDTGQTSQELMGEEVTQVSFRAGQEDTGHASQGIMGEEVTRMSSRAGHEDASHTSRELMGEEVTRAGSKAVYEGTAHTSLELMGEEVTQVSFRAGQEDTGHASQGIMGEEVTRGSSRAGHEDTGQTSQELVGEEVTWTSSRAEHEGTAHTSQGIMGEEVTWMSSRAGPEGTGHTSHGIMGEEKVTRAIFRPEYEDTGHASQGLMEEKEVVWVSSTSRYDDTAHTSQGIMGEEVTWVSSRAAHEDTGHTSQGIMVEEEEVTRAIFRPGHEDTGRASQGLMGEKEVIEEQIRIRLNGRGPTSERVVRVEETKESPMAEPLSRRMAGAIAMAEDSTMFGDGDSNLPENEEKRAPGKNFREVLSKRVCNEKIMQIDGESQPSKKKACAEVAPVKAIDKEVVEDGEKVMETEGGREDEIRSFKVIMEASVDKEVRHQVESEHADKEIKNSLIVRANKRKYAVEQRREDIQNEEEMMDDRNDVLEDEKKYLEAKRVLQREINLMEDGVREKDLVEANDTNEAVKWVAVNVDNEGVQEEKTEAEEVILSKEKNEDDLYNDYKTLEEEAGVKSDLGETSNERKVIDQEMVELGDEKPLDRENVEHKQRMGEEVVKSNSEHEVVDTEITDKENMELEPKTQEATVLLAFEVKKEMEDGEQDREKEQKMKGVLYKRFMKRQNLGSKDMIADRRNSAQKAVGDEGVVVRDEYLARPDTMAEFTVVGRGSFQGTEKEIEGASGDPIPLKQESDFTLKRRPALTVGSHMKTQKTTDIQLTEKMGSDQMDFWATRRLVRNEALLTSRDLQTFRGREVRPGILHVSCQEESVPVSCGELAKGLLKEVNSSGKTEQRFLQTPGPCHLQREKAFIRLSKREQEEAMRKLTELQLKLEGQHQMDKERQMLRFQERLSIARNRKSDDDLLGTHMGNGHQCLKETLQQDQVHQKEVVKQRLEKVKRERTYIMQSKRERNTSSFKELLDPMVTNLEPSRDERTAEGKAKSA